MKISLVIIIFTLIQFLIYTFMGTPHPYFKTMPPSKTVCYL